MRDKKRGAALLASGREIHLVDVENLLGNGRLTAEDVLALRPRYAAASNLAEQAHVVIATSHPHTVIDAGLGWEGSRRTFRPGADGADLALLAIAEEDLTIRYGRLVIGSGDHRFAPLAANFQAAGGQVTVVTRRTALSMQLRLAVTDIRYLPEEPATSNVRTIPDELRSLVRQTMRRAA